LDLDRTTIIAGLKIKLVRDAVREMARHDMNDSGWTVASLADQMNISPTHAEWLSEILVEQKILERKPPPSWDKDPAPQIRYALGEYGTRFTLARMLKRIDRAKVDDIIAELLKRVTQINANPELCYFVNEIRLFGSAMNGDADSFGDVDIAYDLGRRKRPPQYKDWHDWAHKRWKLAGRSNLNFMQQLYYAEHEVLRLLKERNQYLSIHNFDDLVGIGADSIRLSILPEDQLEAEDSVSGEQLHQARMASAKERVEKKEQRATEKSSLISTEQSPEQIKRRMITAVQSLAFDLLRAIDEPSPPEAFEQSIAVAHLR
jgi:predicted nucleotidyltransferase/aryl carrier-like protein